MHLCVCFFSLLAKTGWTRKLQNEVYRQLLKKFDARSKDVTTEHIKEPLAYIRRAQVS